MEREITKQEFKELYVRYGQSRGDTGWTQEYWDQFYEHEAGERYFFTEPTAADQLRMFISSGDGMHRIFLLSEEAESAFFQFPE